MPDSDEIYYADLQPHENAALNAAVKTVSARYVGKPARAPGNGGITFAQWLQGEINTELRKLGVRTVDVYVLEKGLGRYAITPITTRKLVQFDVEIPSA